MLCIQESTRTALGGLLVEPGAPQSRQPRKFKIRSITSAPVVMPGRSSWR
jgi:hypothetical protein